MPSSCLVGLLQDSVEPNYLLIKNKAVDAMHRFIDDVARHGNWNMSDADEVGFLDRLRARAARLFHADPGRIAIFASASELLGQIPFLVPPIGGRKIVVVTTDFPAVTRPWLRLAASGECKIQFVEDDPASDLTSDLIAALEPQTALVAVS